METSGVASGTGRGSREESGRSNTAAGEVEVDACTPKEDCTPNFPANLPVFSNARFPGIASNAQADFRTPNAQVVKKQRTASAAAESDARTTSTDVVARELDAREQTVLDEMEKVCLDLAAVEVALRRCSTRSEQKFSLSGCKSPNQLVYKTMGEYKVLSQRKRSLLAKARKLRRSIYAFTGVSTALAQQIQYVDFALSVTTTVPGLNDLEDDRTWTAPAGSTSGG